MAFHRWFISRLFLLALACALMALTPPPVDLFVSWSRHTGNGSKVKLEGPHEALFIIRRTSSAPKRDAYTHGYAYLLSPPIALPPDWRYIEISGQWWRDPPRREAYPELALRINARPPLFIHGNTRGGVRDGNFIHIGIRSWNPAVYFLERGADGRGSGSAERKARFPDWPKDFMLVIRRESDGSVSWSYLGLRDGIWREIFRVARSRLFEGTRARQIRVKIGGWTTLEYPYANHLHVRGLQIRVSSWQMDNGLPGNFELDVPRGSGGGAPWRKDWRGAPSAPRGRMDMVPGEGMLPFPGQHEPRPGFEKGRGKTAVERPAKGYMARGDRCDAPPFVMNARTRGYHAGLQQALDAARAGDVIRLGCGVYHGNFRIRNKVVLQGPENRSAVLDGDGRGVVLRVDARGSVVKSLTIRNSGIDDRLFMFWRGSGVVVAADAVRLKSLRVEGNGNGISVRGVRGVRITDSEIRGNRFHAVSFEGVRNSLVKNVRMERNGAGLLLTTLSAFSPAPPLDLVKLTRLLREGQPSAGNNIINNRITGNGNHGIVIDWFGHDNAIQANTVDDTGQQVRGSFAAEKRFLRRSLARYPRPPVPGAETMLRALIHATRHAGSAIILARDAHDNTISKNVILSSAGHGVVLDQASKNKVKYNLMRGNTDGVLVVGKSRRNAILHNRVFANRHHGLAIGGRPRTWVEAWPTKNVIARNDMRDNGNNAFDASAQTYSRKEIITLLRKDDVYRPVAASVANNPRLLRTYQALLAPGDNRWDSGGLGNHHSDFDEDAEGFRDENGDGVGDAPRVIPGGNARDRFPLSAARGEKETRKVPLPPNMSGR